MIPSIIAIDGPAASGKSTIGEMLAQRLGYLYFDTGVMYRAVTAVALARAIAIQDEAAITRLAEQVHLDILPPDQNDGRQYTVRADARDVTWDLRTRAVDANVSTVSAYRGVRAAMKLQQRRVGERGRVVMVGRDIGTVVFPDADLKIFLDATAAERARRRQRERLARGEQVDFESVLREMLKRDEIDSTRSVAPLKKANDAVNVDSTGVTVEQVLARVIAIVEGQSKPARDSLWFYRFGNHLLRFVFSLILRMDVRGVERVPRSGALIIAISHSSWLDPVLLGPYLPRFIASMGKVEIFDWLILGGLLRAYGAFPVRRGKVDVSAFKVGLLILKQGYAMGIAPEGHRSESGKLQRGREGAIMLAVRSGAPILPVAVWGGKALWKNLARFRKTQMQMYVGAPVELKNMNGKVSRELLTQISDELMHYIAELMPPELHGYYENKLRAPEYLLPVKQNEGGDGGE